MSGVVEDLGNAAGSPDATGNLVSPLAGVTVSAGSGLGAVTASDGSFTILGNPTASTLGVPPGSYTLSVSSVNGYGAATFWDPTLTTSMVNPVTVASGQTTTVGVALVATDVTLSGQVTDQAGGNAIPGHRCSSRVRCRLRRRWPERAATTARRPPSLPRRRR